MSLQDQIKKGKSRIRRRAFIKRRLASTGLFEPDWYEITKDIEKWGSIKIEVDAIQSSKFRFGNLKLKLNNEDGSYNNEEDQNSLWHGYASQQRTLFKVQTSYLHVTLGANGIYSTVEFPANAFWDRVNFDQNGVWDKEYTPFKGILWGDIPVTGNNSLTLNIAPLTKVFQDFPARNLDGYTSTGLSASQFMESLRDQTDGSGSFIFRPFFDDTLSNWNISTTTVNYSNLNTSTAADIRDKTCWEVIELLAEAESYVPYVDASGVFNFTEKTIFTATAWEFYGPGSFNNTYGRNIKKISKYGPKITKFYSRVQVKFKEASTITSYFVKEANFQVSSDSAAWNYGYRTLDINNTWIPDTATASTIATTIFNDLSALKNEIEFSSTLIPELSPLNRIKVSYDSTPVQSESLWGLNNWTTELTWDASKGDAMRFQNKEFKLLSVILDLDRIESRFIGREA